jgi:hypothetical protein
MSHSKLLPALAFTAAILGVLDPSALTAQSIQTSGTVEDAESKPIKNAMILAENPNASPSTFSATTDQKGRYSLAGIKPGVWKLTISLPGFVTETSDIVVDDRGDVLSRLHFVLRRRPATVGPGIQPLTAESLKEALDMSEEDVSRVSSALLVKLVAAEDDSSRKYEAMTLAKDAPFDVMLLTPFSRAGFAAAEARRKFATPTRTDLTALNKQGLIVVVSPGTSFVTADAVEGMVIRRGDQVIKPLTSVIKPTMIENRMGAKSASAVGRFTFPMDVFAPKSPLTIVIIGKLRNFEIPMSEVELGLFR